MPQCGRDRVRADAGLDSYARGVYFNYRQKGIASIASIKFRGEAGVGGQQLLVDVGITMQPDSTPSPPRIFSVGGQLSIGGTPVAPLQPAFVFWHCFADYSQKNDISLRAFLSHQQVRAVDERRSADGGFVFDVQLISGILGLDGLSHAPLTGASASRTAAFAPPRPLTSPAGDAAGGRVSSSRDAAPSIGRPA